MIRTSIEHYWQNFIRTSIFWKFWMKHIWLDRQLTLNIIFHSKNTCSKAIKEKHCSIIYNFSRLPLIWNYFVPTDTMFKRHSISVQSLWHFKWLWYWGSIWWDWKTRFQLKTKFIVELMAVKIINDITKHGITFSYLTSSFDKNICLIGTCVVFDNIHCTYLLLIYLLSCVRNCIILS